MRNTHGRTGKDDRDVDSKETADETPGTLRRANGMYATLTDAEGNCCGTGAVAAIS